MKAVSKRLLAVVIVASMLWLLPIPSQATIHDVAIDNFFFAPLGTHVYPGDTVRWTLVNGVHTTTAEASSPKFWDSGIMSTPGSTFLLAFTAADAPGPYPYLCSVHPSIMKDTIWVDPPPSNALINNLSAGGTEQVNPEVAWSEANFDEAYIAFTDFTAPGYSPPQVGLSISLNASLGSWTQSAILPIFQPNAWNPTVGSNVLGGYLEAQTEFVSPAYLGISQIVMHSSTGGGAPFTSAIVTGSSVVGVTWLDYPVVAMDEDPFSPPASAGTGHLIYAEFVDGDGDANFDGNLFNDPADKVNYWYVYTNLNPAFTPPFLFPAFSPPVMIAGGLPVFSPSMSTHRPAMDVVRTAGPTPAVPPGGLYVVYPDYSTNLIMIMASPAPGAGFGSLGGPVPVSPFSPNPPVSPPGTMYGTTVDVAVDDGPLCPGKVYVVWSGQAFGIDADILFSASSDGGFTWTPPIKVNQDPLIGPIDQYDPRIDVDPTTGDIIVVYYDRRNDPANTNQETWVSVSSDCGISWKDCKVSDAGPTPPVTSISWPHLPAARYVGDYLGFDLNALNGPGFVWNDGRNGSDQDVFFAQRWNCSCCVVRGDFNHDGVVDITDLTDNVDWLFSGGTGPVCMDEADIDGSGTADIADLTYLVDYLFGGGPGPVPC